jgi:hypothetical protein
MKVALIGRDLISPWDCPASATLDPGGQPSLLASNRWAKSGLFTHLETRIRQGIPRGDSAVAAGEFLARAARVIAARAIAAPLLSDTVGGT